MSLPPFKVEEFFIQYEFSVPFMLGSSDPETMTVNELLGMADHECSDLWNNLKLSYTQVYGLPLLRQEISALYQQKNKENVLLFAGAEEGIYVTMHTLLAKNDHVVVLTPCYESLKVLPKEIGANVTEFELEFKDSQWQFDIEKFKAAVRPETKLIVVNFPHNPTGFLPSKELFKEIVAVAKQNDAYLFCDEVYRLSEYNPEDTLPAGVDCYEKAISLSVMSKSYGLPGLRLGWLVVNDLELLKKIANYKTYTTICNSAPAEVLSLIALRNRDQIIARNIKRAQENLKLLQAFFQKHEKLFEWEAPTAGFITYPRFRENINVDQWVEDLIEEQGVIVIPGSKFDDSHGHFRIGFGRENMPQALARFAAFVGKKNENS